MIVCFAVIARNIAEVDFVPNQRTAQEKMAAVQFTIILCEPKSLGTAD